MSAQSASAPSPVSSSAEFCARRMTVFLWVFQTRRYPVIDDRTIRDVKLRIKGVLFSDEISGCARHRHYFPFGRMRHPREPAFQPGAEECRRTHRAGLQDGVDLPGYREGGFPSHSRHRIVYGVEALAAAPPPAETGHANLDTAFERPPEGEAGQNPPGGLDAFGPGGCVCPPSHRPRPFLPRSENPSDGHQLVRYVGKGCQSALKFDLYQPARRTTFWTSAC